MKLRQHHLESTMMLMHDRLTKALENKNDQLWNNWREEYGKRKAGRVGIPDKS